MPLDISKISLKALAIACNFISIKRILQLRQVSKLCNERVCYLVSAQHIHSKYDILFDGLSCDSVSNDQYTLTHFTIRTRRCYILWLLFMRYMLNKIEIVESTATLNIDPSCYEVSLLLSTEEVEKLLGFIKPLTSHTKFRHARIAGHNNGTLIRSILEFIDCKFLESLTIEYSNETCRWLYLFDKVRTDDICVQLQSINKETMDFVFKLANKIKSMAISVGNESIYNHLVPSITQEMFSRNCNQLKFDNFKSPISLEEAEKIIKICHRIHKPISLTAWARGKPKPFDTNIGVCRVTMQGNLPTLSITINNTNY